MQYPVKKTRKVTGEQDNQPPPRVFYERRVRGLAMEGIDLFGAEYALGVLVACAVSIMEHMDIEFRRRVLKYMSEKLGL